LNLDIFDAILNDLCCWSGPAAVLSRTILRTTQLCYTISVWWWTLHSCMFISGIQLSTSQHSSFLTIDMTMW